MRLPLLLAFLALACYPVRADMFNNKLILVGDKGAALGGAYAGLADDATSTFYNPAGMTQLRNIKLNVSAQIIQFQKQQIEIAPGTILPYNSFNFSPSITAFSQRLGKWAYGFSVVTPENDLFRGEQSIEADYRNTNAPGDSGDCPAAEGSTPCFTHLDLSYNDVSKVTLIGPSGAMKFSDNISLGVSLYGIYYTQLERTSYGGYDANYVGGNPDDLSRFQDNLVTRTVNQTGLGITGSFGILVRMDQGFSFGVNASPGSLVRVARTEEQRVEKHRNEKFVDADTAEVVTRAELYILNEEEDHTEISAPRISLGVSWRPVDRLMLTAQTDYVLGSLYSYTGYSPLEVAKPRSGFENLKAREFTYTVEKKAVVNFSAGADFRINKEYSVAMGGYTDFSQGPYDSRPASWDRRVDYFGFACSMGIEKQYTESRFGFNAAFGDAGITHFQWATAAGGQPIVVSDAAGNPVRERQSFDAYNFGIFLSSTLKI